MFRNWIFICCALCATGLSPAFANSEEENGDLLASALSAVASRDWIAAEHRASQISDPIGVDLVAWARLRRGEGDWEEYLEFLDRHPDWPGVDRLHRQGEELIPKGEDPAVIRAYFADKPPQTGTGSLRFAKAMMAQGRTSDARAEIRRAWLTLNLSRDEQTEFLENYRGIVSQVHERRLENLLWDGETKQAERMLELVSPPKAAVAKARIGLQRGVRGIDQLLEAVPESSNEDSGLAYDRFVWRLKKDRWDEALEILEQRDTKLKMTQPEKWAGRRATFSRRAMRKGEYERAYALASKHGLNEGSSFADLEWLSGYLSLTFMGETARALEHFQNFDAAVSSPISKGRAGYWLGRTHEELGDLDAAAAAYTAGAQHQTSFYGQLAAEKLSVPPDQSLAGKETGQDWRDAPFVDAPVLRAALLLHYAQEPYQVRRFFTHMADGLDREGMVQLTELALEMDRPFVAVGVAKEAAKRGIVLTKPYFPITDLATYSADIEPELAMAIARRESELNETAVSPAGARGLMQVMPSTARKVAEELGIEYSKARLTSDWRYNATLGTAYLAGLLEIYSGSYVLAFAAYNAGPHRADAWIERYGDPRLPEVNVIDWIEHIPFNETRNYVMRVAESLHVYRARLKGKAPELSLTADLERG